MRKKSTDKGDAQPPKKIRRASITIAELKSLTGRLDNCVAALRGHVDGVEDLIKKPLEFDGANGGDKALERLVQFVSNLTKAIQHQRLSSGGGSPPG